MLIGSLYTKVIGSLGPLTRFSLLGDWKSAVVLGTLARPPGNAFYLRYGGIVWWEICNNDDGNDSSSQS